MGPFKFNRAEHELVNTQFASFLRRHLRDEDLFTAVNKQTGRWFLGYWINRDTGLANDVDDLGPNMEFATRELVKQLARSRQGVTARDVQKRFTDAQLRGIEIETQDAQERQEVQDWLQKRSGSDIPVLYG